MNDSGNVSEAEDEEERRRILYHQSMAFEFAMLAKYYPVAYYVDLVLPFVIYVVGFIGNSVSAVLWFQRKLRRNNSSAFYMALTLIDHLLYLALHCVDQLNKVFQWHLSDRCYLYCEVFMYLLYFARYMSPLLVLGFVGERFVAVCYPLRRRLVCRTRMARTYAAIGGLVVAVLCVAHPVFWTRDPAKGFCGYRDFPGVKTAWQIFSPITEVVFLVVLPLVVVLLDLIVVIVLCRIRRNAVRMKRDGGSVALQKLSSEKQGGHGPEVGHRKKEEKEEGLQRPMSELSIKVPAQATTAFILSVSLYEAVCLMADATVYLLLASYPPGDPRLTEPEILSDPTWVSFLRYSAAQCVVYALALTRHGCLILFFLAFGTKFREALCDLIRCRMSSPAAATTEMARNTWVSSSSTGSRARHLMEPSGN